MAADARVPDVGNVQAVGGLESVEASQGSVRRWSCSRLPVCGDCGWPANGLCVLSQVRAAEYAHGYSTLDDLMDFTQIFNPSYSYVVCVGGVCERPPVGVCRSHGHVD